MAFDVQDTVMVVFLLLISGGGAFTFFQFFRMYSKPKSGKYTEAELRKRNLNSEAFYATKKFLKIHYTIGLAILVIIIIPIIVVFDILPARRIISYSVSIIFILIFGYFYYFRRYPKNKETNNSPLEKNSERGLQYKRLSDREIHRGTQLIRIPILIFALGFSAFFVMLLYFLVAGKI